jgi:hypothetical protein
VGAYVLSVALVVGSPSDDDDAAVAGPTTASAL